MERWLGDNDVMREVRTQTLTICIALCIVTIAIGAVVLLSAEPRECPRLDRSLPGVPGEART